MKFKQLQMTELLKEVPKVKKQDVEYKGDYKIDMLDLLTGRTFTTYIKNEYFLRRFEHKCKYSKKVKIIGIEKMY